MYKVLQPLFMKKYSTLTLRPLWIVLPFLPLICSFYNLSTLLYSCVIFVLFIYFFPLLIVLYACMFLTVILPERFFPVFQAGAVCMAFVYCGFIAYYANKKLSGYSIQLSLCQICTVYLLVLSSISLSVSCIFGYPASNKKPRFIFDDEVHLIRELKNYRDDFGMGMSRQHFLRIEYEDDFVDRCIAQYSLMPYPVQDVPELFWSSYIIWWQPNPSSNTRALISEKFTFDQKVFHDGKHFFIYDMPDEQICYIWYKSIF